MEEKMNEKLAKDKALTILENLSKKINDIEWNMFHRNGYFIPEEEDYKGYGLYTKKYEIDIVKWRYPAQAKKEYSLRIRNNRGLQQEDELFEVLFDTSKNTEVEMYKKIKNLYSQIHNKIEANIKEKRKEREEKKEDKKTQFLTDVMCYVDQI